MSLSLREENKELREENHRLHAILEGLELQRWRGLRVIRSRALMLGMLSTGGCFSAIMFLDALQARYPRDDEREPKSVNVNIHHLRRMLAALNPPIAINTEYGVGYYMTPENKALLLARKETQ